MSEPQWLRETQSPGHRLEYRINRVLAEERSRFQKIVVAEIEDFGRTLILDDVVQTTQADEFIYHEMLAHVALLSHPRPQRVLVVGGGDGGTVREVLRHSSVETVHLAEIDERVVELSREHLRIDESAFKDPRLEIIITDGVEQVRKTDAYYDVILVDAPDPIGPGERLFEAAFYQAVRRALRPDGLFATQSGAPFWTGSLLREVYRSAAAEFPFASVYLTAVPTYPGGYWSYVCGSLRHDPAHPKRQPERRWPLRCYTPELHRAAFHLPRFIGDLLASQRPAEIRAVPRRLNERTSRA